MKKLTSSVRLAVLGILATIATGWTAPIINLQDGLNGYTGTRDTYLTGDNRAGLPNSIHGSETTFAVAEREASFNNYFRGLIKFDVSSITPARLPVTAASLTLTMQSQWSVSTGPISLYLVSAANGAWTEAQATWNNLNQSVPTAWAGSAGLSTPGTDYIATAIAVATPPATISVDGLTMTWTLNAAGVAAINNWVSNPSLNYGFFLRKTAPIAGNDWTAFYSSEYATLSYHPLLAVTIPEPASVALLGLPLAGLLWRRRG